MPARLTFVAFTFFFLSGILAERCLGADGLWLTDFEAAKALAKSEKKLLLVDFTGSDWCPPCMRLKAEVFDGKTFQAEAPKQFVLVELDFPNAKEQPEDLKLQNRLLQRRYEIHSFPSVLILDAEGKKLTKTGYRPGGDEEYLKHLQDLVATHEQVVVLRSKLDALTGLARARALDEIVTGIEKLGVEKEDSQKLSQEIMQLDGTNQAGLKLKHGFRLAMAKGRELLEQNQFKEAQNAYREALAIEGITGEQKQLAHFSLGECFFNAKDFGQVIECLKQAHAAAPMSDRAANLQKMIERFTPLANAHATLTKLKAELETAQGLERAKILDQLIDAQGKLGRTAPNSPEAKQIEAWKAEIIALDADNQAGLKAKHSK